MTTAAARNSARRASSALNRLLLSPQQQLTKSSSDLRSTAHHSACRPAPNMARIFHAREIAETACSAYEACSMNTIGQFIEVAYPRSWNTRPGCSCPRIAVPNEPATIMARRLNGFTIRSVIRICRRSGERNHARKSRSGTTAIPASKPAKRRMY